MFVSKKNIYEIDDLFMKNAIDQVPYGSTKKQNQTGLNQFLFPLCLVEYYQNSDNCNYGNKYQKIKGIKSFKKGMKDPAEDQTESVSSEDKSNEDSNLDKK